MIPQDKSGTSVTKPEDTVEEKVEALSSDKENPTEIIVYIGSQATDGTWHEIKMDLAQVIKKYSAGEEELSEIMTIITEGSQYKLDNVMLTEQVVSLTNNKPPYLFHIGPVYDQMFSSTQSDPRFIYVEDEDLMMHLNAEGIFESIMDADGVPHGEDDFDPSTAKINNDSAQLYFIWKVGGSSGLFCPDDLFQPIPVDPNNIPFLYLPKLDIPASQWVWNKFNNNGQ